MHAMKAYRRVEAQYTKKSPILQNIQEKILVFRFIITPITWQTEIQTRSWNICSNKTSRLNTI
jgi:hypothetical protein